MKNNKIKYTVLFLLLLMCGLSIGVLSSSPIIIQDVEDENIPKSSAGEITIVTPENKTYTQPDTGYFLATYGFECDTVGEDPLEWSVSEALNTKVEVLGNLDNHKNVISIIDNNVGEAGMMNNSFGSRSYGTVEFYIRVNDSSMSFNWEFTNNNQRNIRFRIYNNYFQYDSGSWHNIRAASNDIWYHIKIDFECTGGGYEGLNQYRFFITIDGTRYGEFSFTTNDSEVNKFLATSGNISTLKGYYDAIGFSWDPYYAIGDNLKEGLLLSYENATNLDWQGYSLDGQTNKTILGNTTIPIPGDGFHSIKVFGNSSLGTMYESALRHFAVDTTPPPEISITYPSAAQEFSDPPSYILSIEEENVAVMWYILNGGSSIPFTSETGTIDSTAWNTLADGPVTIRFYVRDIADREVFDEVIVVKIAGETPTPPPEISGYNLIAFIGLSLAVSVILVKRKHKK
jgi:hypothetical protein